MMSTLVTHVTLKYVATELQQSIVRLLINIEYGNTNNYSTQECHNIMNMIIPKNWLNYYVAIDITI